MEDPRGKENNDNAPPRVGDWVYISDEESLRVVEKTLGPNAPFVVARIKGQVAYLVNREDYKPGMYIPTAMSELKYKKYSKLRFRGMLVNRLRIVLKPGVVGPNTRQ